MRQTGPRLSWRDKLEGKTGSLTPLSFISPQHPFFFFGKLTGMVPSLYIPKFSIKEVCMQVNSPGAPLEPDLRLLIAEVKHLETNKSQTDGETQTPQSGRLSWVLTGHWNSQKSNYVFLCLTGRWKVTNSSFLLSSSCSMSPTTRTCSAARASTRKKASSGDRRAAEASCRAPLPLF